MNTPKSKKNSASKPRLKLKDLASKKDPKGGAREISVTEPEEPTFTKPT